VAVEPVIASADVVVPTFRRVDQLERCLHALAAQTLTPRAVVVVVRPDDADTWELLATRRDAKGPDDIVVPVAVDAPGAVAALRAGVAATRADVVAFTDDDAAPPTDWLCRLVDRLREPGVGVVGGRDIVPGEEGPRHEDVGTLAPWGRLSGAHHLGIGPRRDVDTLKGVCMAFRADALALPEPGVLHGSPAAEPHNELLMCAWASARGWRIVYDPSITVAHDGGRRSGPRHRPSDVAYNRTRGTLALAPQRRAVTMAYGLAVGAREAPGIARGLLGAFELDRDVLGALGPSIRAQLRAARDDRRHHPPRMTSCHELRSAARG
jgi:GT2 family glycosyltransferase